MQILIKSYLKQRFAKLEQKRTKVGILLFRKGIKKFTKDKQKETSLNGFVYDFSVDHRSIKKEYIFNIHQYLLIKNNIK